MYILRRNLDFKTLHKVIKFYSITRKSHYETLNVHRNCSDKDIKDAFIKMSKKFHPDKNKDVAAQEKFVRIVEAYNILSKPNSRAQYDSMTSSQGASYVYKTHVPYNIRRNQYKYAENQESQQSTYSNYYQTVAGIKKLPNYIIILMCCGVVTLGCVLQVFVIRELYLSQRKLANEKSKRAAEELEKVRAAAISRGNDLQTQLILEKIVSSSNPTVATASLGQALASEKK